MRCECELCHGSGGSGKTRKNTIDITLFQGPEDPVSKNGLLTANSLLDVNADVIIILREDGVFFAEKKRESQSILSGLVNMGVKVLVCGMCMDARNIKDDDLIERAKRCCMLDIVNMIKSTDKSLTF